MSSSPQLPDDDRLAAKAPGGSAPLPIEIRSRAELAAAVRATVDAALARDARTLLWADTDFADWPLDDPALLDALTAWLRRPLRRLQLLAVDYEALARAHPRFAAWRVDWTHAIEARRPEIGDRAGLPTLLIDDGPMCLELLERDPPNGRAARDAQAAWRTRERIGPVWQRAEAAWPARPLGL
jgi:hypothetical protein